MNPYMSRDAVRALYTHRASSYDITHETPLNDAIDQHFADLCSRVWLTSPPKALLDLGCGTCRQLGVLSRWLLTARVVGLDMSTEMIQVARSRAFPFPLELTEGDMECLPFPAEVFSSVISTRSSLLYVDPARVLSEVHRVLRSGGTFLASLRNNWSLESLVYFLCHGTGGKDVAHLLKTGWIARPQPQQRGNAVTEVRLNPIRMHSKLVAHGFVVQACHSFPLLLRASQGGASRIKDIVQSCETAIDRAICQVPLLRLCGGLTFFVARKP